MVAAPPFRRDSTMDYSHMTRSEVPEIHAHSIHRRDILPLSIMNEHSAPHESVPADQLVVVSSGRQIVVASL
jgi:hypothetical protein